MSAIQEFVDAGPWDFSDERVADELRRAIALNLDLAQRLDAAQNQVERMLMQHHDFVENFGEVPYQAPSHLAGGVTKL